MESNGLRFSHQGQIFKMLIARYTLEAQAAIGGDPAVSCQSGFQNFLLQLSIDNIRISLVAAETRGLTRKAGGSKRRRLATGRRPGTTKFVGRSN
ncbi:hypothetical protein LQ948_17640 [Jiella sp. MQZ9-1]|uniref:Uncharacterized protein n=1 Tax=Jiella flava TaxID=2816857 RepID=A0A939G369_9HYPH|nr:hypothetical protein [Jiella flava]MBO0664397.1 hypothetical protein [Jiella flava]MCD2473032.1 hypothetical protein [Jiella flava]